MLPLVLTVPLEGWACQLDAVPDDVFAGRMLGDGIAIDPIGDTLHAPCDAIVGAMQASHHALTLTADEGVEILIHLGLDTVALGGRGFVPLVATGDRVARGDPLIRLDLDLLVREARAMVTPIIVIGDNLAIVDRAAAGPVTVGAPLMTLVAADTAKSAMSADAASAGERSAHGIVVPLAHGIHARPAARIAAEARRFSATVTIVHGDRRADARSPVGLLALGIGHDAGITIDAAGHDATDAASAIATLILGGMGEIGTPAPVAPPPPVPPPTDGTPADGTLAGVTAAPGLAIGHIRRFRRDEVAVAEQGRGVAAENAAFAAARTTLAAELATAAGRTHGSEAAILAAHAALLDDPGLIDATHAAIERGDSAGRAWRDAIRPQAEALRNSGDAHVAERAGDLLDLERRLLLLLCGEEANVPRFPQGTILVADDLLPSDLMALDRAAIVGLCIERGGATSHAAILAAGMELPMLVAIGAELRTIADETPAILDAGAGLLHLDPPADRLAAARAAQVAAGEARAAALARAGDTCRTADGIRIEAFANLGSVADARIALANGAEGSGLVRTEFLFLERDTAPDVAEQTATYQAIADALPDRPLIVRLLDIGGDKPAPYWPIPAEENPALGLRGIRVGLMRPAILDDQLRAILAVRPIGQCRIMVPMVASVGELRAVRVRLDRLCDEIGHPARVELGVMVETPAAAITADLLAREADFLSIGSNDLTQYALAMDRGNAAVADGLDGLHPAVLRLIGEACRGASSAGRPTGVCGGLASDPLAIPILIGLGVTELSSAPVTVPAIKSLVARLTIPAARAHAAAALACTAAAEVRALARAFAMSIGEPAA